MMGWKYCGCCGRDYVDGKVGPDCNCDNKIAMSQYCRRCKACLAHCGCKDLQQAANNIASWDKDEFTATQLKNFKEFVKKWF